MHTNEDGAKNVVLQNDHVLAQTQINQWTCNMKCIEKATKLDGKYSQFILLFFF
jgi:hypothetical protein